MRGEYNPSLVLLSYFVAVLASQVTLTLVARAGDAGRRGRLVWHLGAALTMGTGIWSMHFIGMLAFQLPIQTAYDGFLTALSFLLAVAGSGLALHLLRRGNRAPRQILISGALMGCGIAAMHYTGMAAMRINPGVTYEPLQFTLSIVIAIGGASAALWLCFHPDRVRGVPTVLAQPLGAFVMGAAIVGMHYTGMGAARFSPDAICVVGGLPMSADWFGYIFGLLSIMLLLTTMALSYYHARLSAEVGRSAERLRQGNEELERRVAERTETLARTEAHTAAILRAAPDGIIVLDAASRVIAFNPAAERIYGYSNQEAVGRNLVELTASKAGVETVGSENLVEFLCSQPQEIFGKTWESTARRRDGSEFPVEVTVMDVRAQSQAAVTLYVRDISVKQQTENALRAAKEEAEAGLRAKSAFLAMMSHEIRTPMNAIVGTIELLDMTGLDVQQRDSLKIIKSSTDSLLQLINDVLDFSKIEAGRLEIAAVRASLRRLVEGVVDGYRGMASTKGLVLRVDVDPALAPEHRFDPVRMRQILGNFVSNAVKFTERGIISVEATLLRSEGETQRVRLMVRDTGIGIDRDTQQRLFQPFEQGTAAVSRQFGGTGLGLAICRRLIDAMGGEVRLSSERGLGTTIAVEFTLPVERSVAEEAAAPNASVEAAVVSMFEPIPLERLAARIGPRAPVLIIDDHPTNLHLLRQQLRHLGYEVVSASGGAGAMRIVEDQALSAIITDFQMPDMTGIDIARHVRAHERAFGLRRVPIIAFTANSHISTIQACQDAGIDGFIAKPANLKMLEAELSRLLDGAQAPPVVPGVLMQRSEPIPADAKEVVTPAQPMERVLARLRELADGDSAQMGMIVTEFAAAGIEDLDGLQAALKRRDLGGVWRFAHRLKGSLRTIGADRLADCAEELGVGAADGDHELTRGLVMRLCEEFEQLLAALTGMATAA